MKKIFFVFLCFFLILPVYSNEAEFSDDYEYNFLIEEAVKSIESNKTKEAETYFQEALNSYPFLESDSEFLYYFSKTLILNDKEDLALKYFLKSVEIDPYLEKAYLEIGKIYLLRKEYLNALNAFQFALKGGEFYRAEGYNYIGIVQFNRGSIQSALENFEKAVEIYPERLSYLNNLLNCYRVLEDKENEALTIKRINSVPLKTVDDYIELAQILCIEKNYGKAKEILENAKKLYPSNFSLTSLLNELNNL